MISSNQLLAPPGFRVTWRCDRCGAADSLVVGDLRIHVPMPLGWELWPSKTLWCPACSWSRANTTGGGP